MEPFNEHVHLQRKPIEWAWEPDDWYSSMVQANKMVQPGSVDVRSREEVGRIIKSNYQESYHVFLALSRKNTSGEFTEQTRYCRSQRSHSVVQVNYSRNLDPLFKQLPFCPHLPSASRRHESNTPVTSAPASTAHVIPLHSECRAHKQNSSNWASWAETWRAWGQPTPHGKTSSQKSKMKQKRRYPFVPTQQNCYQLPTHNKNTKNGHRAFCLPWEGAAVFAPTLATTHLSVFPPSAKLQGQKVIQSW